MQRLVLRILSPPSALHFCLFTGVGAPLLPGAAEQGILASSEQMRTGRRAAREGAEPTCALQTVISSAGERVRRPQAPPERLL